MTAFGLAGPDLIPGPASTGRFAPRSVGVGEGQDGGLETGRGCF